MFRVPVLAISVVCLEHLQYRCKSLAWKSFARCPCMLPFKGMDRVGMCSGLVILENSVTNPRTCDSV